MTLLLVGLGIGLGIGTGGCAASSAEPQAAQAAEDDAVETEAALAVLKRMSDYMGALDSVRFEAEIRYDAVQASGQRLEFGSDRKIAIQRPRRALIDVLHGDGQRERLTFDGERLSATLPQHGVYASIEHTGTVSEVFERLTTEVGVASPLTDLLDPGLYEQVVENVVSGLLVGPALVSGVACDHLAFRGERVDFQLFVEQGDRPVPLRMVVGYREEPGAPQFRATLYRWEPDAELPDELFHFVPPIGLQRVPFPELFDLLLGSRLADDDEAGKGEEP